MSPVDQSFSQLSTPMRNSLQSSGRNVRIYTQGRGCSNVFLALAFLIGLKLSTLSFSILAAEAHFLGKDSCASSGCHGGGGPIQNQSITWARQDPHSRAQATLTTARSKRLAQLLKIDDPTRDVRCTSCHAPWQNLSELPAQTSAAREAVSCESCHGPASSYLRSHTRSDLTRSDKLLDGLRDLTVLYNRANTCVACHQVVDSPLLEAGHPQLLFELDGQSGAMPRHWRERPENSHAAGWLTGQSAALRELTAQLLAHRHDERPSDRVLDQWQSVLWVLKAADPEGSLSAFNTNAATSSDQLKQLHRTADKMALEAPERSRSLSFALVQNLCRSQVEFAKAPAGSALFAARAERLVLALDRLLYDFGPSPRATEQTEELFRLVQSRPDFAPDRFASSLALFQKSVTSE